MDESICTAGIQRPPYLKKKKKSSQSQNVTIEVKLVCDKDL